MTSNNWQQAKDIFNSALELSPELRGKYVADACAGDTGLRQQVDDLLSSYHTEFLEDGSGLFSKPDTDSLKPGEKVGRYDVIRLLGAGGMGAVYLAYDPSLDRRAAIKLISAERSSGQRHVERFIREAQSASALNHPNICTIYEINSEHDPPYIAMEYVEGDTLVEVMNAGPVDIKEKINVARQIAGGLAEAHAVGIVHRDIKPANIIINKRGHVKIVDFGLAKKFSADFDEKTRRRLSVSGMIMGTVSYMSPEQAKGGKTDARSDIFSFGILLYELFGGRRPFDGDSVAETIAHILTLRQPALSGKVSPSLQALIDKCLEKDSVSRYQSMDEVTAELERIGREYSGGHIPVPPQEQPTVRIEPIETERITTWPKILKPKWIAAFVGFAVVISAAIYGLSLRNNAPQVQATSPAKSPAYDLYIRGKVKVTSVNPDDNDAAIKLLEQAVAIDPNYAEAWAALAKGYVFRSFNFAPGAEQKKLNEDAEVAVEKALELNPNLPEGHLARGLVLWTHAKRFPHEQAIQAFERAISLNPDLDEAHQWLSAVYIHIGLFDSATREINKTLGLNPNNTTVRLRMVAVNYYQGKYEEAISLFKTTPPDEYPANLYRITADSMVHLGRLKEADALINEYLKKYPTDEGGNVTSVRAILLAKEGKQQEAETTIQRSVEIGKGFGHFHHAAYNIASAYALMNKPDEAMKWLQDAADDGFPCYPYFEIDHQLDNIRADSRFIAFMSKLKEQWLKYKAEYDN